jgi:hypothetical protein
VVWVRQRVARVNIIGASSCAYDVSVIASMSDVTMCGACLNGVSTCLGGVSVSVCGVSECVSAVSVSICVS